ncbi:CD109 antigen-like [Actinia tenebrosa]|uniref:CD109 antigen n=1 Tax=Actinia tenebrosa TaxID=6105 RepID=A0A6P8I7L3_ACTTE|nr:CD109 antigen-like [Actinia tenebrosa]
MAGLNVFAFLMLWSMLMTGISAKHNGTYFISAPKLIRPGSIVSLKVSIMNAEGPVHITAGILEGYHRVQKLIANTTGSFSAGSAGTLDIQIPSGLGYGRYDMFVNGTGGLTFYQKNYVDFRNKGMSFYVQTDKGIYKPGHTVHMRVFALLPNLQSYMGKMTVDIVDPNNNKMAHWPDLQEPYGVIKKDFKLTSQPVMGNWRISVSGKGENHNQYFEVKEYVLPKFEVTITLPPLILKKDSKFRGSVSSKYTYGQGVKGTLDIEVYFNAWSNQKIKKQLQLTGTTSFDFDMEEILRLYLRTYKQDYECKLYQSWYTLSVNATVTEGLTGKTASNEESVKFYYSDIKLEFPSFNPKNYKPGLDFSTVLKVTRNDGELVDPTKLKKMKISVSTMYSKLNQEQTVIYTPSPEGMIVIHNQVPKDAKELSIRAEYKHDDEQPVRAWFTATKSESPSNSYLQLSTTTPTLKSGETIQCRVKSNFPLESYVFMVLSRGAILQMDSKTLKNGVKDVEFSLPSTSAMAPSARIVFYSITNSKEVVADGLTISVENPFDNEVNVEFNKESSRPGDKVQLMARATPGSQVAFLAIDKSVLLLNKDNDISRSEILNDLQSFVSGSGWYPWWDWDWHPRGTTGAAFHVNGRDAYTIFRNSGLITFTDCLVHRASHYYPYYGHGINSFGGGGGGGAFRMVEEGEFSVGSSRRNQKLASVTKIRSFFPETWLWADVNASSSGEAQISTTVPDTITSWVASAFAISPKTGFGIGALKPKLKVFQPFFISLDLPYSVVRGEEIAIKALIFNYLEQPQEVTVTFKGSKDWKAINASGGKENYEQDSVDIREVITVPAGEGKAIAFPIIPKTLGNVPLEVQAQSYAAADAVKRNLLVEPEGIPQEYSYSLLIDLNTTSSFTKTLEVALPNTTVPGSSYVKASLIGDILGSSFNNLGDLLRMPYGCGEQNMLRFAPNIFILKYLTIVNKVTKEIKNKAEIFMEQGYQRQQSYRHSDGSYSAFGRIDPEGSMWLTAFVVKSFAQAREYIYIDPRSLSQSLGWIARKQNKDGSFPTVGPVLHGGSLQGGLKGNVSLTAFVTIALAEAGNDTKVINVAKEKAVRYLESNLDKIIQSKDVYSLAITAYALRLVESGMSWKARAALLSMRIRKAGTMYWSNEKPDPGRATPFIPYYRPRSADVEITAYTLLALSLDKDLVNGLPVVRWLSQQRNALGGYSSTQDTVLGIQAMSDFASFIYSPSKSFKVELTHSGDKTFSKTFNVDNNNEMVLQQVVIPKVTGNIKVTANGHGFGMLQIGVRYHVTKEPVNSNFDFIVKVLKEEDDNIEIEACAQYLGKEETSNMAVMEIGVASGFAPDKEVLKKLLSNKGLFLKRTESEDKKLILYFDKFEKGNATCVKIGFERTHAVGKGQPVPAVVYDYYNPENRAQVLYMADKLKDISICSICPTCVNCNHKKVLPLKRLKRETPIQLVKNSSPFSGPGLIVSLIAICLAYVNL